jgi:hypothetical protein
MTERVNYRAALALMRQKFEHPRDVIKALGLDAALEDCENNTGGRTPDRDSPLGRAVNLQNGEPKGNQLVGDQPSKPLHRVMEQLPLHQAHREKLIDHHYDTQNDIPGRGVPTPIGEVHGQEDVETRLDKVRGVDPDRDIPSELVQIRDYLKRLRPEELQDPKLIAYLRTNYTPDELDELMSLVKNDDEEFTEDDGSEFVVSGRPESRGTTPIAKSALDQAMRVEFANDSYSQFDALTQRPQQDARLFSFLRRASVTAHDATTAVQLGRRARRTMALDGSNRRSFTDLPREILVLQKLVLLEDAEITYKILAPNMPLVATSPFGVSLKNKDRN